MKPDTTTAMRNLIQQVRRTVPFDTPDEVLCSGICRGCAKKLLEFLDMELEQWEYRLDDGEAPNLGDIKQLAKRSRKIYSALKREGLAMA